MEIKAFITADNNTLRYLQTSICDVTAIAKELEDVMHHIAYHNIQLVITSPTDALICAPYRDGQCIEIGKIHCEYGIPIVIKEK